MKRQVRFFADREKGGIGRWREVRCLVMARSDMLFGKGLTERREVFWLTKK